jgi:tRNA dimethylallyltransferase
MTPKPIVLLGPTAVGKSLVAVRVAEALGGEIIGADSRQIYQGMDIGTAKPGPEMMARVPHHLINTVKPDQIFSAGQYREMAQQIIFRLQGQGKIPVIVGGTGLYLRALLHGLWSGPKAQWDLRRWFVEEEKTFGPGYLHQRLAQVDPGAAFRIHPRDQVKIIRALEVAFITGIPLTQHHEEHTQKALMTEFLIIGLRRDREDLYRRINDRVDAMIRLGLAGEAKHLLKLGFSVDLPSLRGLGYRQIIGHLQGLHSLEEAIRLIKRDTRRYAKRQMTWFRKEPGVQWVDLKSGEQDHQIVEKVLERIQSVNAETGFSKMAVATRSGNLT